MSLESSSQFRRSGQRDGRRRRLLAEEPYSAPAQATSRNAAGPVTTRHAELPPRKSENYGDAAFMDESLRLIDLIPRRLSSFGLLLLAGLIVVVALEVAYAWMPRLAPMTTDGRVAALDLDAEGGLAVWFSSAVLALAALVAVLVFTVRRHKTDDYQGHYRVWLWAAMCWLLMSIDEASSLHEGFKQMMTLATGTPLHGDGSLWWVIPYFFLLGAVGSRLLLDMRCCKLSSGALVATAGCYALAVGVQLLSQGNGGARAVMLEEGAEMVGNLTLLLAMGLHARYVVLDAEGRLPRREPTLNDTNQEDRQEDQFHDEETAKGHRPPASSAADEWITVEAAHQTPPPARGRTSSTRAPLVREELEPEGDPEPEPEPSPVRRKLTKAERKALRKRLAQERLQREREQHRNFR